MASTAPLLADVEKGTKVFDQPPTQAELDAELALGKMTKIEWMLFVTNPKNIFTVLLMLTAAISITNLAFYEVLYRPLHWSYLTAIAVLSTLGLTSGAYNSFLLTQLKEQIDRFRALNKKLSSSIGRLEDNVDALTKTGDDLRTQVESFALLQAQMKKYADESGRDFKAVFNQATELFEKISKNVKQQQRQLLIDVAQKMEFMDSKEGMTKTEFARFRSRVPDEFKGKFAKLDFEKLANAEQDVILYETIDKLIKEMI